MNRISLASGVLPEFGPVDTVLAAAAGGFDAVGLWEQCGEGVPLRAINALPAGVPLSIELCSRSLREAFPDPGARARTVALKTLAWLEAKA